MTDEKHILISLEPRHAENILSGKKKFEFRSRTMHVDANTTVWIYVKMPVGAVVGKATIDASYSLAPSTLWRKFSKESGLTSKEFFEYFQERSKGFALALSDAKRIKNPVSLATLRTASSGFQPPQFFTHLPKDGALLAALCQKK
ncbi:transcriptional regulator [Herminiimonas sp. NPDC097707]|uniref:transcriptional regulator n=1 Tax=Herminiimonas sp. NPDC097707 TaxID=3364007 RepID=UPI00383A05B6